MPVYHIKGKNGAMYEVTAADDAQAQRLEHHINSRIDAGDPGLTGAPIPEHGVLDQPPVPDTSLKHVAAVGAKGFITGLNDALGVAETIGNPAGALLNHLSGMTSPSDWGSYFLGRGKFGKPETPGQNVLYAGARGAGAAGPFAAEAAPAAFAIAGGSGAVGGASSELTRQAGYGPGTQALAGLLGGGLFGMGLNAARPRAPVLPEAPPVAPPVRQPTPGQQVYQAADRLGIGPEKLLPADVGGTGTRMATAVSRMTLGGIPIAERSTKTINALRDTRNSTAAAAGTVQDATGAGQAALKGVGNWNASNEARSTKLYESIPIHPERPVTLTNSRAVLQEITAGLKSNPKLSAIIADPRMADIRDALVGHTEDVPIGLLAPDGKPITKPVQSGGSLSWQDLQDFRSYVGEKIGQLAQRSDLTSTKQLKALYGGLSEDMRATAASESPQALRAFTRANDFYSGWQKRLDSSVRPVLGRNLDNNAMNSFESIQRLAARHGGDPVGLGRLMRSMSPDEADSVRATYLKGLGRAKSGVQDPSGEVFSPTQLVTDWNNIDGRAKAVLFNKPGLKAALDDLVTVAGGVKAAEKYANTSKTALAANGISLLTQVLSSPFMTGAAAGLELGVGGVLSSTRLVRALAGVGRAKTPGQISTSISQFAAIARRHPELRPAALSLQAALNNAMHNPGPMNDNLPRLGAAAASPNPGPDDNQ